jgi:serine/threonine protein kinase
MAESHLEFTKPSHVVGRYALYGRLAAGGMATVHLGRVLEADGTSRTVAVKRLHPQFCKDPEFVAMFIDEARLAARIKHPNVVETLDILTMGQELLLVMEYIRGECFSKLLRAARRKNLEPSIGVVGRIASGMLHGLHAAHEARDDNGELLNVVHRDISPQNVMIDVDGGVKVLDFGVAKASARIQITRDGQMKGKLSYMSPEQLQGLPVDRRADVFACGVVLWEALTRRRLFVGEDASEVLRKILRDEVPPPSQWMPGLSPEVDQVVLRALSKDPEQRYQTAEELALDVEQIIDLAPPEEVGAWLDSVAGEILGKRDRLLQEIERLGVSDVSFDAHAGTPGHGSITDSDTFQRIQSWAEREAARVVADGQAPFVSELDDPEAEPTKTVADARCVEDSMASDTSSSVLDPEHADGAFAGNPFAGNPLPSQRSAGQRSAGQRSINPHSVNPHSVNPHSVNPHSGNSPIGMADAESAVTPAGDSSYHGYGRPPPLPSEAIPVGTATASGLVATLPPRRERRFMFILAAAAIVLGLGAVAIVSVPPSTLVRTNALLPEGTPRVDTSSEPARDGTVAAVAATQPAAETTELAASGNRAGARSTLQAPNGDGSGASNALPIIPAGSLRGLGSRAPTTPPGSVEAASGPSEQARSRVTEALTQPAKAAPAALPKKTPKRATVARRAKPAPSAAAAGKPAASPKVDCRQPFWIDEGGIRRLKMACL